MGVPRFLVVDYKTNWLGPRNEVLSAWHYRTEALAAEMQRDHYPLQAILYMVALHRYLRWRMPGYDPAAHLARSSLSVRPRHGRSRRPRRRRGPLRRVRLDDASGVGDLAVGPPGQRIVPLVTAAAGPAWPGGYDADVALSAGGNPCRLQPGRCSWRRRRARRDPTDAARGRC